jgi:hypothetical protein
MSRSASAARAIAYLSVVPTSLDNGRRSPKKLLRKVVARLIYAIRWSRREEN